MLSNPVITAAWTEDGLRRLHPQLLTVNGFWGKENLFCSGLWPQVGWPCSSGWHQTQEHIVVLMNLVGYLKKRKRKKKK